MGRGRPRRRRPKRSEPGQAYHKLRRLAHRLRVSKAVVDRAAQFYGRAFKRGLVRGRSILALIAASLYAACRYSEAPLTLREIAKASGLKMVEAARCYRFLVKKMRLRVPLADPIICVSRIAAEARISERTKRQAVEILRNAIDLEATAGKSPMGLAAAALYAACIMKDEGKTQKQIAKAAEVTEMTVRNRYKGLKAILRL